MSEREIHLLPEYTEQAMGYVWDKPIVRWIAVYQRLKGNVVWHDGMTQDSVPEGFFPIMESL